MENKGKRILDLHLQGVTKQDSAVFLLLDIKFGYFNSLFKFNICSDQFL